MSHWWSGALPVLVGNNRVYSRCGCKLVITYQEIGLLLPPPTWYTGPPAIRGRSSHLLTPPYGRWVGALPVLVDNNRVYSRCGCKLVWPVGGGRSNETVTKSECKHRLVTTGVAVSLIMINTEDHCSLSFWSLSHSSSPTTSP